MIQYVHKLCECLCFCAPVHADVYLARLGSIWLGMIQLCVVNIVMLMLMFGCCVFCYVIVTVTVLLHLFGG